MILYGVLTQTSIRDLFIARLLPGMLTILGFMQVVTIITRMHPRQGPTDNKTSGWDKAITLLKTWPILILFGLIIGGIYLGVFTPTEASGMGAVGAFLIAFIRRKMDRTRLLAAFRETLR